MGRVLRGSSKNARFFVVDSTEVVAEALRIHRSSPTATKAFGRLLTAGMIMGETLKGDDLLTLRTDTDGVLNHMVVTTDAKGGVKGYMSNPTADIVMDANASSGSKVAKLVGQGTLRVIKDMGMKEPYVGISNIHSGEIAQDLAYYYYTSEQTPTVIALGVSLNPDMTVKSAGGYMVQLLPGADDEFIDALEKKIGAIRSINELLEGGMELESIARLLYDDMDIDDDNALVEAYDIAGVTNIEYRCNCERDKFYRGLLSLGKEELGKAFDEEGGSLSTECHFCGKVYTFTKDEYFK